jgi:predicted Zn-dependent peptidase
MPDRLEGFPVRRHVLVLSILLAAVPCFAFEQTLPNGLRVVLIPHRANPMVASAVVVGAGVVDEPKDASGASHFLEHLLFDGTTTRTQRQLYDDADRIGAYNNATTREDHTLFTLLVAKEHAEEGLALQADMLFRSTIPEESFEKERKIVLEELARDRSDPSYDVEAAFRAMAYAGTPIARPVLGTEGSLAGITRELVLSYYKARYVPANMTLVVMGDFDTKEMSAAVSRTFGAAPAAAAPRSVAPAWPAPPKENVEIVAAENDPARLLAAFPFPSPPWDATTLAATILLAAASEGNDSPLVRALAARGVTDTHPALGIEPRRSPWSTVVLDVRVDSGVDPKRVLEALCEAIRSTRAGGEARARIDRVVARSVADAAIARDQIHYFAMLRSSSIPGSPKNALVEERARLEALGPADWDAASERLIAGLSALRARIAGPGLDAKRVSFSPPAATGAPAEAPSAFVAGSLANGLRYVVRQSLDSDVFAMHVAFAPRGAAEPAGREGITDMLHRAMGRATIVHDPVALEARLASLGARVKVVDDPSVPFDDYYTTPEFSWLRLEVPASGWREAVAVLAEMVRFPALTAEAQAEGRREMKERVARRDASPKDVAAGALDGLLAPDTPLTRRVYGTAASLDAITLDDLIAYHAAFAVGRRAIVSVIGPIGSEDVVRALTADFGPIPAGATLTPSLSPQPSTAPLLVEAKLGKTQAYLAMGLVLDVPPGDRAALTIAVAMLSDRLAFTLRETKGLAYAIGASLRPWGGRMRFDVAMGTRPENLDEAQAGIVAGLRAFRESTVTAAEVERAINVARGAVLMRRMTRISLAYEAGMEAMRGAAPGDERRFVDSLREVRAEDVKRVAAAYLDPDRLAVAVVR